MKNTTMAWYEQSYQTYGMKAQRHYPNEELCRFIGGYFLNTTTTEERSKIKVLEVGCGTGANLWMLVKEGFNVHGLELSATGAALAKQKVSPFGEAEICEGNMLATNYSNMYFDIICDVFSGNCFNHSNYQDFLKETGRILKSGGLFFFYTPCTTSEAFTNHAPAQKLDAYTLNGIYRKDSPFYGNEYPFHFLDAAVADDILREASMQRVSLERVTKTYCNMRESFSWLVGIYKKA
jgi:SAM-dependent methyltransferase